MRLWLQHLRLILTGRWRAAWVLYASMLEEGVEIPKEVRDEMILLRARAERLGF